MDWDNAFPIIMALSAGIGLLFTFISRKKTGPQKIDELYPHLQSIGVKAIPLDMESEEAKALGKRSWGEKAVGVFDIRSRNIDTIVVIGVSSQYGTNYYIEYIVNNPGGMGRPDAKKTSMHRKKNPPILGKVMDIYWKGDTHLSQRLDFDYQIKYKLLQGGLDSLKGNIQIIPETKKGYTRIKTGYVLPAAELLDVIDSIAKHVKSWA